MSSIALSFCQNYIGVIFTVRILLTYTRKDIRSRKFAFRIAVKETQELIYVNKNVCQVYASYIPLNQLNELWLQFFIPYLLNSFGDCINSLNCNRYPGMQILYNSSSLVNQLCIQATCKLTPEEVTFLVIGLSDIFTCLHIPNNAVSQ